MHPVYDNPLLSDQSKLKKSFMTKDGDWEISVWEDNSPGYFIWYVTCRTYSKGNLTWGVFASGCCGDTPEDALDEGKRRLTEKLLKSLTDLNNLR